MARVIKAFSGAPDGLHAKRFNVGDEVTGNLARVAIDNGWAVEGDRAADGEGKKKPPRNRSAAPERNKAGKPGSA